MSGAQNKEFQFVRYPGVRPSVRDPVEFNTGRSPKYRCPSTQVSFFASGQEGGTGPSEYLYEGFTGAKEVDVYSLTGTTGEEWVSSSSPTLRWRLRTPRQQPTQETRKVSVVLVLQVRTPVRPRPSSGFDPQSECGRLGS